MHFLRAIILFAFSVGTNGHFLLNYPQTRGFNEDLETNFCGGFPLSNRSEFPLSGGMVSITSEHPQSDIDILISFDANPTMFGEFNQTASGTTIPFLLPFTKMNAQGDACFPVNISSLGLSEAQNGANATIMVQYNGGDGELYQCADVMLSNSFSVPSGTKCDNATGAFTSNGNGGIPLAVPSGLILLTVVLVGALISVL
ncbi:hypothetical protein K439DRAFT_1338632 [Ramaria rubella]|nr:hypothetical protein K439DRAFT_1338632 [Ramaria rubella]